MGINALTTTGAMPRLRCDAEIVFCRRWNSGMPFLVPFRLILERHVIGTVGADDEPCHNML